MGRVIDRLHRTDSQGQVSSNMEPWQYGTYYIVNREVGSY